MQRALTLLNQYTYNVNLPTSHISLGPYMSELLHFWNIHLLFLSVCLCLSLVSWLVYLHVFILPYVLVDVSLLSFHLFILFFWLPVSFCVSDSFRNISTLTVITFSVCSCPAQNWLQTIFIRMWHLYLYFLPSCICALNIFLSVYVSRRQ